MNDQKIKVLQVIRDFKKGGVQAEVMWPARIIPKEKARFDVLLLSEISGYYEEEFEKYGDIYRIVLPKKKYRISRFVSIFTNPFFVYRKVNRMLKSLPKYDAVHCHDIQFNAPVLMAAKKNGVPVRIAHSAVNRPEGAERNKFFTSFYLWICSIILKHCSTSRLGVTQNASDYIFGKGNGRVIKNPTIDLKSFDPNRFKRENPEVLSLIMVGSISPRKNQSFAVDVIHEIRESGQRCKLKIIGYPRSEKEGYLPMLRGKIDSLDLSSVVEFLPQDADIPYHMSQSDFLLMPSLQEGLPNVALEAQAMNLPCVISTDVSTDCDCGLCTFLPLSKGAKFWSDYLKREFNSQDRGLKQIDMSEWDNEKVCREYLELWRGNIK